MLTSSRAAAAMALLLAACSPTSGGDADKDRQAALRRADELEKEAGQLRRQGQAREALAREEEALALRRKVLPAGDPGVLRATRRVAGVLMALGEWDKARAHLEPTVPLLKKALGVDHLAVGYCLNDLARTYGATHQLDKARRCHEEALPILRKRLPAGHLEVADTLSMLGFACQLLQDWEPSRRALEEAVELYRRMKPPPAERLVIALTNLGQTQRDLGQLGPARRSFDEAQSLFPADRRDDALRANPLLGLGNVLLDLNESEAALTPLKEALAIRRKRLAADHEDTASCLNSLGMAYHQLGRRAEAREHFAKALAMFRKAFPPDHPEISVCLGNLALAELVAGQPARALELSEAALAMLRKTVPPQHPDVARAVNNVAAALIFLGEGDRAWRELTEATRLLTSFRRQVVPAMPREGHGPLLHAYRYTLDTLLRFAEILPRLSARQRHDLLAQVLDSKAMGGTALRLREEALVLSREPAVREQYGRLRQARQALADRVLRADGPPAEAAAACEKLQRQIEALESDLAERVRDYAELRSLDEVSPDGVVAALPPGAVLVEAVAYEGLNPKRTPPLARSAAALLAWRGAEGETEVRFVHLGLVAPIAKALAGWRAAVQKGEVDAARERELRELVWEPLAKALPEKTTRLVIAPDGELALLPFEALRLEDGKYLVERYAVRYVTSGRDLLARKGPAAAGDVAVVVSDPAFEAAGEVGKGGAALRSADWSRHDLRFGALPGFRREAEAVGRLLKGTRGWGSRDLGGAGASEEALAGVKRPRLLYCITHGFFLQDVRPRPGQGLRDLELVTAAGPARPAPLNDPRVRSGLALAGANKWQERSARGLSDGLLTALEVENLDLLGTELVVLSACETGLGEVQVGEGVVGLRNAFQQAGARTVLASLWKVPDAETEQLMSDTLSRWLKGSPPHEALREAQLEMIRRLRTSPERQRREAPPLYWAGFVCHGR